MIVLNSAKDRYESNLSRDVFGLLGLGRYLMFLLCLCEIPIFFDTISCF